MAASKSQVKPVTEFPASTGTAGDHPVSDSGDHFGYAGDRRDARTHADGGGR